MSAQNNGGSAFPINECHDDGTHWNSQLGMTLRDYFAAKAMHAELNTAGASEEAARCLNVAAHKAGRTAEQQIAFNAYEIADAMLAERAK